MMEKGKSEARKAIEVIRVGMSQEMTPDERVSFFNEIVSFGLGSLTAAGIRVAGGDASRLTRDERVQAYLKVVDEMRRSIVASGMQ